MLIRGNRQFIFKIQMIIVSVIMRYTITQDREPYAFSLQLIILSTIIAYITILNVEYS